MLKVLSFQNAADSAPRDPPNDGDRQTDYSVMRSGSESFLEVAATNA